MNFAYDFDWSVLWRDPYGVMLIKGLGMTIFLGISAWIIAMAVGIAIGTLRITNYRLLRLFGTAYNTAGNYYDWSFLLTLIVVALTGFATEIWTFLWGEALEALDVLECFGLRMERTAKDRSGEEMVGS